MYLESYQHGLPHSVKYINIAYLLGFDFIFAVLPIILSILHQLSILYQYVFILVSVDWTEVVLKLRIRRIIFLLPFLSCAHLFVHH